MAGYEVAIELTDAAKEVLVEQGFDPAMGARPLRRAIQRFIEDPLADFVLGRSLNPGATILVDRKEDLTGRGGRVARRHQDRRRRAAGREGDGSGRGADRSPKRPRPRSSRPCLREAAARRPLSRRCASTDAVLRLVSDTVSESSLTPPVRFGRVLRDNSSSEEEHFRRTGFRRASRYGRKMGRRARSFYPGVPTHLTARGVDDQPIFRSDLDRYELLALLRKVTSEWTGKSLPGA